MSTVALDQSTARGVIRRPLAETGFFSWFTTVDHKKLGLMYIIAAFGFGIVGGVEALLIRLQLAQPDGDVLSANAYNQAFTMHGTTMIFLMVMPVAAGLGNYLVPLQIGARDVAFPRINALGFWVFMSGGIFLYSSMLFGSMADGGWFGYEPLAAGTSDPLVSGVAQAFLPGEGMSFWALGLIITGIGSLVGAINFIVTIINMRAPGMALMRMPVFTWMIFIISFMLLFAVPVITVALIQMFFDKNYGTHFFQTAFGGEPLLWQHLFWLFGHPEVYILILPAMGAVSEILPVFARKPLFGYSFVVFSGAAIGLMGWGVWAHHMFATGIGPVAVTAFSLSTMFIAVPTGVKIFNWLGTIWGGSISFKTPMLFSLAFIAMFVIGGLSGVTHSIAPHDRQQTDTYYIVAHFHYVLFGGAIFGIMAGAYYWFPKMFGVMLHEGLGKVHFWLMLIGFNLTFGPMHILGLQGQPRRTYTYPEGMGWDTWNLVSTIGSFTIMLGFLVFAANWLISVRNGKPAGDDPWDARTLEWATTSPPPPHNFDVVPIVEARDDWWHQKYSEDEEGRMLRRISGGSDEPEAGDGGVTTLDKPEGDDGGHGDGDGHGEDHGHAEHIHMPSPSYHPFIVALGIPLIGYGFIEHWWFFIPGGLLTVFGIFGWALEPDSE
jgi:cytochrome c oxidase subunit I